MLSLAIVSLSPSSAASSSSTGAAILHGPHHSAQKSTSTGLSLPRTSLAKLESVTFTVLPAMEMLPRWSGGPPGSTGRGPFVCPGSSALVERLGEPAFGVDPGGRAGAGGGDRLPVDVVDHVTAGEDTRDVGARGRVVDLDVAGLVELELTGE